jgi:hypothetical protein
MMTFPSEKVSGQSPHSALDIQIVCGLDMTKTFSYHRYHFSLTFCVNDAPPLAAEADISRQPFSFGKLLTLPLRLVFNRRSVSVSERSDAPGSSLASIPQTIA